jgi:hypothetical protein
MKQSLRKTPTPVQLAYRSGEAGDSLVGRNLTLMTDGRVLTLSIDLTSNFRTRNKSAAPYLDAVALARNHEKLKFLQCGDNLVRARLIKAWDRIAQPRLRLCLDLGSKGRYLYTVLPHSLFMGGIQLDVQAFQEEEIRGVRPVVPHHGLGSPRHPA